METRVYDCVSWVSILRRLDCNNVTSVCAHLALSLRCPYRGNLTVIVASLYTGTVSSVHLVSVLRCGLTVPTFLSKHINLFY